MAQKRMFDKAIIDTDRFMDLSMSAKALYFLLGMEADDEGFVSYKKVMRIHGGNEDDIKILVAKTFLIAFDSGVVVITDWNKNNWLDSRRLRPTEYQKEKSQLVLSASNEYSLSNRLASIEEKSIEESRTVESKDDAIASQVNDTITLFEAVNPSYARLFPQKTQRSAVVRLLKLHGFDTLKKVIEILPNTNSMPYFPTITTPIQLEDNWAKLDSKIQQEKNKKHTSGRGIA